MFVDGADDDGDFETGDVIEDGLRVADVVEDELEIEFAGKVDGDLEVAGLLGGENDSFFALEVGKEGFEFEIAFGRIGRLLFVLIGGLRGGIGGGIGLRVVVVGLFLFVFGPFLRVVLGIEKRLAHLRGESHAGGRELAAFPALVAALLTGEVERLLQEDMDAFVDRKRRK